MCSELAVQVDKDQDKFIDVHTIQLTKGGSELIISSRSVSLFIFTILCLFCFCFLWRHLLKSTHGLLKNSFKGGNKMMQKCARHNAFGLSSGVLERHKQIGNLQVNIRTIFRITGDLPAIDLVPILRWAVMHNPPWKHGVNSPSSTSLKVHPESRRWNQRNKYRGLNDFKRFKSSAKQILITILRSKTLVLNIFGVLGVQKWNAEMF